MNFVLPLQLGVRDVAFSVLNSVGFWLTAAGVLLVNISLVVGEFAKTGWLAYPPLSELAYSPGVGVDYYLWSLQISGLGTLLTGINLTTTILKLRAPGMSYSRMPIFCWTALASNLLIIAAFPILTGTFAMLLLDRYLGFHFFSNDLGGSAMMYINLIWAWGHPEVYILILPASSGPSPSPDPAFRTVAAGARSEIEPCESLCAIIHAPLNCGVPLVQLPIQVDLSTPDSQLYSSIRRLAQTDRLTPIAIVEEGCACSEN